MGNFKSTLKAIALLLAVSLTANAQKRVVASGKYKTEKRSLEFFQNLEVAGSFQVTYVHSNGSPSVEIYASDNLLPLIETKISGNKLILGYKPRTSIQNSGKIRVKVSGPVLQGVAMRGSGSLEFENRVESNKDIALSVSGSGRITGKLFECNTLRCTVSGSGRIELGVIRSNSIESTVSGSGKLELRKIDTKQMKGTLSGSGRMILAGQCQNSTYSISGSGSISAEELETAHVAARTSGSGSIKVYATQTLTGSASGSGGVAYKGNPEVSFSQKGLRKL